MGKGDAGRPQQPELARSERSQVDPRTWTDRDEPEGTPPDKGPRGPVPPENRPGRQLEKDQDKPEGPPSRPPSADQGREERPEDQEEPTEPEEDPTVRADEAEPAAPGPGDSEGARPE